MLFKENGKFEKFINSLVSEGKNVYRIDKISFLKKERIMKKVLWAPRLWVCRQ